MSVRKPLQAMVIITSIDLWNAFRHSNMQGVQEITEISVSEGAGSPPLRVYTFYGTACRLPSLEPISCSRISGRLAVSKLQAIFTGSADQCSHGLVPQVRPVCERP